MDSKQLKALLKLLRENGVSNYKTPELELSISQEFLLAPPTTQKAAGQEVIPSENPFVNFPDGMLTPQQLMFYSAGGDPMDDPENQGK